jgi:hypothetical protein
MIATASATGVSELGEEGIEVAVVEMQRKVGRLVAEAEADPVSDRCLAIARPVIRSLDELAADIHSRLGRRHWTLLQTVYLLAKFIGSRLLSAALNDAQLLPNWLGRLQTCKTDLDAFLLLRSDLHGQCVLLYSRLAVALVNVVRLPAQAKGISDVALQLACTLAQSSLESAQTAPQRHELQRLLAETQKVQHSPCAVTVDMSKVWRSAQVQARVYAEQAAAGLLSCYCCSLDEAAADITVLAHIVRLVDRAALGSDSIILGKLFASVCERDGGIHIAIVASYPSSAAVGTAADSFCLQWIRHVSCDMMVDLPAQVESDGLVCCSVVVVEALRASEAAGGCEIQWIAALREASDATALVKARALRSAWAFLVAQGKAQEEDDVHDDDDNTQLACDDWED